ncbi:MAG: uncharacterized protein JWM93_1247 [Frankiales bacterium]|nr:uncharacterized protein [Frankiales bacterium]
MYAWIWHRLPGGRGSKAVCALLLIAAVLSLLFFVVFPWVEPRLPFSDVTVDPQIAGVG